MTAIAVVMSLKISLRSSFIAPLLIASELGPLAMYGGVVEVVGVTVTVTAGAVSVTTTVLVVDGVSSAGCCPWAISGVQMMPTTAMLPHAVRASEVRNCTLEHLWYVDVSQSETELCVQDVDHLVETRWVREDDQAGGQDRC